MAVRVGDGAGAHEDADVRVGGAGDLVHEDVDGLGIGEGCGVRPLALALAKTDVWEGHAGQTQATSSRMQNP